jgi:hypothetical protein
MSKTQYGLPPQFQEVMATPYDGLRDALPTLRYNEFSAAGLTTTLDDLARLAAADLVDSAGPRPGRGVLKEQTVPLMQTAAPASRWADRDSYGPDPQYGLGYTVRPAQFLGRVGWATEGRIGAGRVSCILPLFVVFEFGGLSAQTPAWQPSLGHTQVPIWPGGAVPDALLSRGQRSIRRGMSRWLPAGRGGLRVGKSRDLNDGLCAAIA